jgi:two-component system, cell cycle sensor histidine kinase and response regulator CckA
MKTGTLEAILHLKAPPPIRLLILEHSHHDAELLLLELRGAGLSIEHTLVADQQQFREALRQGHFDIVLSDYRLPGWTGLDALEELRAVDKDLPFLLVTGTLGEEAAVECIKQGVSDYVLKDHISRLPLALLRAIQEKNLREENLRAHRALAESEARAREQFAELDLLYRTAPVGLAMFDPELRFVRINEHLAGINGLPAAELVHRKISEVLPLIGRQVEAIVQGVFEKGHPTLSVEISGKIHDPSERDRCWLGSYFPLCAADGSVANVSAVILEITERKRAEEALRLSELRNHDLVENSVYGIFRVAADGSFLDANPALLRILACDSFERLRTLNLIRDVFRFPEQHAQLAASCRELGQVHGAEAEWRRCDGGLVAVRLHLRRLRVTDQLDSMEVIAEEVTELRAMERQLRQAQKFEAIGQLAGGIAHDFNNVVGAILGWAELGLEQNRSNPQVAERFTRIREQGERAAALTRELLAFARRQILQPRAVDLNTVVGGLASFLDKVISKDIEVKVITAPLDPIKADPTQIEQVLMNLSINARDAMAEGGRLVLETEMVQLDESYCRFYPQVTPGRYAVLSVSDTGMGMDTETRERIFEPFFTTKERGKGTGMGLATVYGIVKQHGGLIHVYSELGQGSLFRVYLPVVEGTSEDGSISGQAPAASTAEMRGTETILLADDHESIREMARQTLLGLGYRVLSAANGEDALRICENDTPALAILDVVMPRLGGAATAAKLGERFANLQVLFTSGYSRDSEGVAAVVANSRYLQKPYSPTALVRMVREILDGAAKGAPSGSN